MNQLAYSCTDYNFQTFDKTVRLGSWDRQLGNRKKWEPYCTWIFRFLVQFLLHISLRHNFWHLFLSNANQIHLWNIVSQDWVIQGQDHKVVNDDVIWKCLTQSICIKLYTAQIKGYWHISLQVEELTNKWKEWLKTDNWNNITQRTVIIPTVMADNNFFKFICRLRLTRMFQEGIHVHVFACFSKTT